MLGAWDNLFNQAGPASAGNFTMVQDFAHQAALFLPGGRDSFSLR
jgi:hypothetical protein